MYQRAGYEFDESLRFVAYDELARFDGHHVREPAAWSFDVGGALQVWRQLGVGVAYARFTHSDLGMGTGEVPHPFFASQCRLAPAELLSLEHRQRMTHLQILWTEPVWDRLDVTVSVGPSFINIAQAVLSGLEVSEVAAPYTTIRVDELTTAEQVVNTVGVHIGADATYMVTPKIGAGFYVRFVGGSADLTTLGDVVSVDVGGVQTGAGIRVRF